jgi:putative ATPase
MKQAGYGKGYRYAHDDPEAKTEMTCLPPSLAGRRYLNTEEPD